MSVIFYFVIIFVLILIYVFILYNKLVKYRNMVKEAFSTMDVYLKKRFDLIPRIVEVLKGYMNYEKETLANILNIRSDVYDKLSQDDKLAQNERLRPNISRLFALSEAYPDLKANENFLNLMKELSKVEEDIANSRKYYNAVVRDYNIIISSFPNNIVASTFDFKEEKMFEIEGSQRENTGVNI